MTRRGPSAGPAGPVGDHQRTTLSFLLTTFAVAVSVFLGLGQAAAAATAADSLDVARPEPAPPATVAVAGSEDLLAALEQLEREPEQSGETGRDVEAPTTTGGETPSSEVAATAAGDRPVDRSSSASNPSLGQTSTTVVPSPLDRPTMPTTSTVLTTTGSTMSPTAPATTSTTVVPFTVPKPPDTMPIREWQPVSDASFRRFVEERGFTTAEYITPALVHGTIVEGNQSINVVLVHRSVVAPMRVSPGGRGVERVGEWAQAIGATAGINANWYNPWDGPAVSAGNVYGGSDHGYTALFGFTADGDLVADHHHKVHERVDPRVVEAVSGHPTLIHRGTPTTDFGGDPAFTGRNPRTAIGVTATVDVLILVTVDGRRSSAVGMTGAETTRLLQRLGAFDAVMLDGGGSSAMWIAGKGIVNRQSEPGRAVGNQIAVFGR